MSRPGNGAEKNYDNAHYTGQEGESQMEKRLTTKELLESMKRCYHMDGDDRGCEGCPNAAMQDGMFAGCRYRLHEETIAVLERMVAGA